MTPALLGLPVDDLTRRRFLGAAAAAGLLTACSSGPEAEPPAPSATRPFEHFGGTTDVPAVIDRFATVFGEEELHAAIVLGARPVVSSRGSGTLDEVLARAGYTYDGIETYPFGEPNLEMIAAARPQVIVHVDYATEDPTLPQLQAIAPVIMLDRARSVDDQLRQIGELLGRGAEAERVIAEYEARVGEVAAVVAASPLATGTVAVIYPGQDEGTDVFSVLGAPSVAGQALLDLGVPQLLEAGGSDAVDATFGGDNLSAERLVGTVRDATTILRVENTENLPGSGYAQLESSLPAAQAGRVVGVPRALFYLESPLVRLERLDEIERIARQLSEVVES